MNKFTLVSFKLCPYVQRVAISMREKGIPFDLVYIDLDNRPEWFTAVSPLGKVPLLQVHDESGTEVLFESSVILEYLEDIGIGRPMHPGDPVLRAKQRGWIEFGSSLLGDIWLLETASEQAGFEKAAGVFERKVERLDSIIGPGPFFGGAEFTFVDSVFAPAFRYFDVFDTLTVAPLLARFSKVQEWRTSLASRPSVKEAVVAEYPDLLLQFLRNKKAWLVNQTSLPTA